MAIPSPSTSVQKATINKQLVKLHSVKVMLKRINYVFTVLVLYAAFNVLWAQPAINYAEYYINTDPGKGNGISIPIGGLPDLSFTYDHSGIPSGVHRIGVRTKDTSNSWSMDVYWMMIKYQSPSHSAIQDIIAAEYYINSDPGKGNGIPITIANLPELTFAFNYSAIGSGVHRIGMRTKDSNSVWSKDIYWVFVNYNTPIHNATSNINYAEYYINVDPGKGNGIPVSTISLPDLSFAFNHTGLGHGVHRIGLRTKDVNGIWSKDSYWLFANLPAPNHTPISQITAAEYYINSDPGKGNGNPVSIAALPNLDFMIDVNTLTAGVHRIGVRTRNEAGQWSKDVMWIMIKHAAPSHGNVREVVVGEYYIDIDPGKGNGNPIVFEESTNLSNKEFIVNLSGLSNTTHKLGVRSKDESGIWSLDTEYEFTLSGSVPNPSIIISSIQKNDICKEGNLVISFDANGTYNPGNVFTAQISDANANFTNATEIGTITATNANLFSVYLPETLPLGSGYKLRVNANNPNTTGQTSTQTLSIYHSPFFPDTLYGIITDCPDGTYNLFSLHDTSTLLTYQWNTPIPIAAPAGNYTLIANNLEGCKDTTTANIITELEIARWLGTTNFDWHTASNWDTGEVPDANTHVIIEPSVNDCTIRFFDADAMSVQAFDLLTIFNEHILHIHGHCGVLPD